MFLFCVCIYKFCLYFNRIILNRYLILPEIQFLLRIENQSDFLRITYVLLSISLNFPLIKLNNYFDHTFHVSTENIEEYKNINIILALSIYLSLSKKNCIEKRVQYYFSTGRGKKISNLLPTFLSDLLSPYPRTREGEKYTRPTSLEQSFQRINPAIIQSRPRANLNSHQRYFILSSYILFSPIPLLQPTPLQEVGNRKGSERAGTP